MIIPTERSLALRCPLCGRMEFHQLSLFLFHRRKTVRISCECGFEKLTFTIKKGFEYALQLPCLICEEVHIIKLNRHEMWETPLQLLRCADTGQELGFLGTAAEIKRVIREKRNDIDSIVNNVGFEDYFINPEIMFETINQVHRIAKNDRLFCMCGNHQIEVEVFPEKLELHCAHCQSLHIVYAETMEDLGLLKKADHIALTEKGFTSFNSHQVQPGSQP